MGERAAAVDVTCSVMVATCTAAPFAEDDAVEPTMRIVEGGLPSVQEKRYEDHAEPTTHPVAVRMDALMETLI